LVLLLSCFPTESAWSKKVGSVGSDSRSKRG